MATLRMVLVLVVAMTQAAAALAAPATTRAAGDAEIVIVKLDAAPSLITANVKNQSASSLFITLGEQSGGGIVPRDESLWDDPSLAGANFSAEWDKQALWDALREACETTNLRARVDQNNEGGGRLQIERGPWRAPASVDGVALVRVQQIVREANFSYADKKNSGEQLSVALQLLLEPKLRGLAWIDSTTIDKAEDETGHSLLVAKAPEKGIGEAYGSAIGLPLSYPGTTARHLSVLRGVIHLHVARELASVRMQQPFGGGKKVEVDVGGNKLTFQHVTPSPDGSWDVFLTLDADKSNPVPWDRTTMKYFSSWSLSLAMVSGKGKFRQNGGSSGWDDRHCELHQGFSPINAGDVPTELRVEFPKTYAPLDVKFEFKDLPLP